MSLLGIPSPIHRAAYPPCSPSPSPLLQRTDLEAQQVWSRPSHFIPSRPHCRLLHGLGSWPPPALHLQRHPGAHLLWHCTLSILRCCHTACSIGPLPLWKEEDCTTTTTTTPAPAPTMQQALEQRPTGRQRATTEVSPQMEPCCPPVAGWEGPLLGAWTPGSLLWGCHLPRKPGQTFLSALLAMMAALATIAVALQSLPKQMLGSPNRPHLRSRVWEPNLCTD